MKAAKRKRVGDLTSEKMTWMQRAMEIVQAGFKAVENTFGDTVFQLAVATAVMLLLDGV